MTSPAPEAQEVNNILKRLPAPGSIPVEDANGPRVVFPGRLTLTRQQEDSMIRYARERIVALGGAMGRGTGTTPLGAGGLRYQSGTHLGNRERYQHLFENNVEWRKWEVGGIFEESNHSAAISRRITRQAIAKAVQYFAGTDPWFATSPVGSEDAQLADLVQKYVRVKLARSSKQAVVSAIYNAFIFGEAVVKSTWVEETDTFRTSLMIAVDAATDEPVFNEAGDYIVQNSEADEPPPGSAFVQREVWCRARLRREPESSVVYFGDFVYPLDAPGLQQADILAHYYRLPAMVLADRFFSSGDKSAEKAMKLSALLSGIDYRGNVQSGATHNSAGQPETVERPGEVEVCEIWLRFDANEDGHQENLVLLVDLSRDLPIYYDYVANVSPTGRRPFAMVRALPVLNRPYGIGYMEMFHKHTQLIDLLMNRMVRNVGKSGRVEFWDPSTTYQGQGNPNLPLEWGMTYTLQPGKRAEDALTLVELRDTNGDALMRLIEFFMQVSQSESGSVSSTDMNIAGLPSAKLATGVRHLERSSNEIYSLLLHELERGIQEVLENDVTLLLSNLDEPEVFAVLGDDAKVGADGQPMPSDARVLLTITPEQARNLPVDVEILLTSYQGEQTLMQSQQSIEMVNQFYGQPFQVQQQTRPLFVQALKALGVHNADTLLQPVDTGMMPPGGGGGAPMVSPEQAKALAGGKQTAMPNKV